VVTPFWPGEDWFSTLMQLSSSVLVVPHTRQLVCQTTLDAYGVNAQGDWPLSFFSLDPDRVITARKAARLAHIEWSTRDALLTEMLPHEVATGA
jgi:hypothetical protein